MTVANPPPLPGQPADEDGPVFAEPWQAQAFALAVELSETGLFTWKEWTESLGAEIVAATEAGDPGLGDTYYDHWLRALESLVAAKQAVAPDILDERVEALRRAYLNTPHGKPVELAAAGRGPTSADWRRSAM